MNEENSNYYISSLNIDLSLKLNPKIDSKSDLYFWLRNFIPSVKLVDFSNNPILDITCLQSEYAYCEVKNYNINLFNDWNLETEFPTYVPKFISQIFQPFINQLDMFTVPASAICLGKKAILFLTDYWQGKTSCALYTLKKHEEVSLISGSRIVAKGLKIISGARFISLMDKNINNFTFVEKLKPVQKIETRTYFDLGEYDYSSCEIVGVIVPQINEGGKDVHLIPNQESQWYLFNKISNLIRGEALLFNGKEPSPSFDTTELSKKRLNFVNNLIKYVPVIYVSGNLERISEVAMLLLNGENVF